MEPMNGEGAASSTTIAENDDAVAVNTESKQEQPLFREIRDQLINFHTMSLYLRVIVGITLALIIVSGLAIIWSTQAQPHIALEGPAGVQIPTSVFILFLVLSIIGWGLIVAGVLQVTFLIRLLVISLIFLLLGLPSLNFIILISNSTNSTHDELLRTLTGSLFVLGIICIWIIGSAFFNLTNRAKVLDKSRGLEVIPLVALCGLFTLFYYINYDASRIFYNGTRFTGVTTPNTLFLLFIYEQSSAIPLIFSLIVYLTSTDLIEIGTGLAGDFLSAIGRRFAHVVPFFIGVSAIAMIVDSIRVGFITLESFIPLIVMSLIIWVLAVTSHIHESWPHKISLAALLIAATYLFLGNQLIKIPTGILQMTFGITPTIYNITLTNLLRFSIDVLAFLIGLWFIIMGNIQQRQILKISGLLLAIVALNMGYFSLDWFQAIFLMRTTHLPLYTINTLRLFVAIIVLILILWIFVIQRRRSFQAMPYISIAILLYGVQIISWYESINILQQLFSLPVTLFTGLLFLIAVLWDFMTSGAEITNRSSNFFPRTARIELYLGYILIGTQTIIFTATQSFINPANNYLLSKINDQLSIDSLGIFNLGFPFVIVLFLVTWGRWRSSQQQRDDSTSPESTAPKRLLSAIAASLSIIILSVSALGWIVNTSATVILPGIVKPYTTQFPGEGCDQGQGHWKNIGPEPFTCTAQGLQMPIIPAKSSYAVFSPPMDTVVENHQILVTFDFQQESGCGEIFTRISTTGSIAYQICSTGAWAIVRHYFSQYTVLSSSITTPSSSYSIATETNGSYLNLVINGNEVASVIDPLDTVDSTIEISASPLISDKQLDSQYVLVRNFQYFPLTANQAPTRALPYHVPVIGAGCDNGGINWQAVLQTNANNMTTPTPDCHPGANNQDGVTYQLPAKTTFTLSTGSVGEFIPLAPTYSISLDVNFEQLTNGCFGIGSSLSPHQGYVLGFCTGDSNFDYIQDNQTSRLLKKDALLITKTTHNIEVDVQPNQLILELDKTTVLYLAIPLHSVTQNLYLRVDSSIDSAVTFSNFDYIPLS